MTQPTSVQASDQPAALSPDRAAAPHPSERPTPRSADSSGTSSGGRPTWRPEPGWRDVLVGRQPDQILARLLDGDPLRLRWLVAGEIRGGAYFLNADRVQLRALARIAHDVPLVGPPADGQWIREHVAGALGDVLVEERRAVSSLKQGVRDEDPPLDVLDALAGPLGFEGLDLRVACDAFNRMESRSRHAFFALFVERRSLDDAAKACVLSPPELAKRARAALLGTMDAVKKMDAAKKAAVSPATKPAAEVRP